MSNNFVRDWLEMAKTKYGQIGKTATPIVIVAAGIYLTWAFARRTCTKSRTSNRPVLARSVSIAALHGGNVALERLNDYHHARADITLLDGAINELKTLLKQDRLDFKKLQSTIGKLEMSGKEEEAVKILETELAKARKEGKSHEAYEIEMMLVEMYIYKGDLEKASKCRVLQDLDQEITDARRPLYNAILLVMQGKDGMEYWNEFKEVRTHFHTVPSAHDAQLDKLTSDYFAFKKMVELLKNDIFNVHKN